MSANDTTAGYLNGKLVAGTNVTFVEGNDGGNETLTINATGGGGGGVATERYDAGNGGWATSYDNGITFSKAGGTGTFVVPSGTIPISLRVHGVTADLYGS